MEGWNECQAEPNKPNKDPSTVIKRLRKYDPMTITTTINPRALEAVSLFVAKKETRYNLAGVFCEVLPNETRFVATDGHALAVYRMPQTNNETGSALIPLEAAKILKNVVGLIDLTIEPVNQIGNSRCQLAFKTSGWQQMVMSADGRFPDYLRCFPRETNEQPCRLAPEYLITMAKAAKALTIKPARAAGFFDLCKLRTICAHGNDAGCGLVTMYDDVNFTGLIMGMRIKPEETKTEPDMWWL